MPAGRQPGMFSAPRGRSRQPMARITASALICMSPVSRPVTVSTRSRDRSSTMVFSRYGISSSRTWSANRRAYSGPVSSWEKVCRPKPAWMHWFRIPPSSRSRSRISRSCTPALRAAMAAARPAGPPPIMASCTCFIMLPPWSARPAAGMCRRFSSAPSGVSPAPGPGSP